MPKTKENPEKFKASAIGFDKDGYLLVNIDGKIEPLINSEVSVRPTNYEKL